LARMVYRDVDLIARNLPHYQEREAELENYVRELSKPFLPKVQRVRGKVSNPAPSDTASELENPENSPLTKDEETIPVARDTLTSELAQRVLRGAAGAFVSIFLETIVIAFYMIFLLQSASRLPNRIRASFSIERASTILGVTERINRSISEY